LLLAGEGEALTRKAVELALAGDPAALGLCLCPLASRSPQITSARTSYYILTTMGQRDEPQVSERRSRPFIFNYFHEYFPRADIDDFQL
jgi:hypothetical protein